MVELIEVKRKGFAAEVLIDGVAIPPEAVRRTSLRYNLDPDSVPTISLELYAERIVIDDDMKEQDSD